jgi:hypothetical protein
MKSVGLKSLEVVEGAEAVLATLVSGMGADMVLQQNTA